jgi:methionyl-tRNA formyltransferase
MHKFVLFLLGQKGYQVLNATVSCGFTEHLRLVVIGRDPLIHSDYAADSIGLCEDHGVPYCERKDVAESSLAHHTLVAVAAGWRWLIREPFRQVLVFHDSLLPKYRGFNPLVTALLNKDTEIGVTAIIASKEFDCGDIVESRRTEVEYPIRIADAIALVSEQYFDLAQAVLSTLVERGRLEGVPQDETQASFSVWRDDEDYRIDWSRAADSITHFVNCLSYPYKGASTLCDGEIIRILHAESVADVKIANRDCGKVLFVRDGQPVVICGKGLLRIILATNNQGRNVLPFKRFRVRLK